MFQFLLVSALVATAYGGGYDGGYGGSVAAQNSYSSGAGSGRNGYASAAQSSYGASSGSGRNGYASAAQSSYGASSGSGRNGYASAAQSSYGASSGSGRNGYAAPSYGSGYAMPQVVQAAVQTRHQIQYHDVPIVQEINPATIEVNANPIPVTILFRSSSSSLNVQQAHDSSQGSVQESSSEDEPHRLVHSVTKPIIQEVHEIITPIRKITQEIQPVQEEVLTIVARGQDQPRQAYAQASAQGSNGLKSPAASNLGRPSGQMALGSTKSKY